MIFALVHVLYVTYVYQRTIVVVEFLVLTYMNLRSIKGLGIKTLKSGRHVHIIPSWVRTLDA